MKEKWYNKSPLLLIILFVFLPPIGLYGILKRNTKAYKKVIASILIMGVLFIYLTVFIVMSVASGDNRTSNKSRESIILESANEKVDSVVKKDPVLSSFEENDSLYSIFNRYWLDSVLNEWNGEFIIDGEITSNDSILLELSENATKNFNSNLKYTLPSYQFDYDSRYLVKFKKDVNEKATKVYFVPNKELKNKYDTKEWIKPQLLNAGLNVYKGNRFSKEYFGKTVCIYKDDSRNRLDGNEYVVVETQSGKQIQILKHIFHEKYWIKKTDPKISLESRMNYCY